MNGMEMMLKTMGLDLGAIESKVKDFATMVTLTLKNFDDRLQAVETQLVKTNQLLDELFPVESVIVAAKSTEETGVQTNGPGNGDRTNPGKRGK